METINPPRENGKAVPPTPVSVTPEHVKQWVKRDLDAACYFLQMLRKHPEILDIVAQELYAKATEASNDAELLDKGEKQ